MTKTLYQVKQIQIDAATFRSFNQVVAKYADRQQAMRYARDRNSRHA